MSRLSCANDDVHDVMPPFWPGCDKTIATSYDIITYVSNVLNLCNIFKVFTLKVLISWLVFETSFGCHKPKHGGDDSNWSSTMVWFAITSVGVIIWGMNKQKKIHPLFHNYKITSKILGILFWQNNLLEILLRKGASLALELLLRKVASLTVSRK